MTTKPSEENPNDPAASDQMEEACELNQLTQLTQLLRLKRYEQPPSDYFENFLREFHSRQRSELLRRSTARIFLDQLTARVADFGGSRAFVGAAACCLAVTGIFLFQGFGAPSDLSPAGVATAETTEKAEMGARPVLPVAEPLPLPRDLVDGPLEIYPVGIQKVGASYYILQKPLLEAEPAEETDPSSYRLPFLDLDEVE